MKINRSIDLTVNSKLQLEFPLDGGIFKSIESSLWSNAIPNIIQTKEQLVK